MKKTKKDLTSQANARRLIGLIFNRRTVLLQMACSHPGDAHLSVILCVDDLENPDECVVWFYNHQTESCFMGCYFDHPDKVNIFDAMKCFQEKCESWCQ